jgi:hypothetical protein
MTVRLLTCFLCLVLILEHKGVPGRRVGGGTRVAAGSVQ